MQPDTVALIRYHHRKRCFAMEQRKRLNLALGSFLRLVLGWSKALPEPERKKIAARAQALLDKGEESGDEAYMEWAETIDASLRAAEPFETIERVALKEMEKIAKTLPVWEAFATNVRGFGAASLGVIVAEAGDLSEYADHSKLWKRMGLAVMDGVRQGGLRKGAAKDDWIAHGYNAQRRSRMWNIGDALIKGNRDGVYRTLYLERKGYEIGRDPEMTPMQAHRRAQRYMEKRLLRDLWRAWRDAEKASIHVSHDEAKAILPSPQQDGQEATSLLPHYEATEPVPSVLPFRKKEAA